MVLPEADAPVTIKDPLITNKTRIESIANEREEIYKSSDKEVTNLDILKRVSNLEKIIYGKDKE